MRTIAHVRVATVLILFVARSIVIGIEITHAATAPRNWLNLGSKLIK